ncbi:unnamed protein product [Blepharisma stoltei]|uniref:Serine carboxypeptidase n=1 Tax=Blepharisma stoltei TaxID=1481888 RepID=A0AAU9IF73_9CILI|nr:unnamed protein product [Blepharisma stoltei]
MDSKIVLLSFLFLCISAHPDSSQPLIGDTDGAWSLIGFSGYAGEITMNPLTGSSYFYWFFEAIKGNALTDTLPLIIWLQGGPGCSGETGMLFENIAPFTISNKSEPVPNPYTWASDFHIMTIDHPLGAGFSVAKASYDMKNTTIGSTQQLYNLLVKLNTKYPWMFNRPIFIFGESFGGHWIPAIAYTILMNNNNPVSSQIAHFNLQGIAIGDPWTDPITQSQKYSAYSVATGLLNQEEFEIIQTYEQQVFSEIGLGEWADAENDWGSITDLIINYAGGINVYNIRSYETNYNLGGIPSWLDSTETKNLLHIPQQLHWVQCSGSVYEAMTYDIMNTAINYLPFVIDTIPVMIYNGQDDLIVNTLSTEAMIANINWPGIPYFQYSQKSLWMVNGMVAGFAQTYENFSFVVVLKSGHMVPHDQPINARDLAYRFVMGEGWS